MNNFTKWYEDNIDTVIIIFLLALLLVFAFIHANKLKIINSKTNEIKHLKETVEKLKKDNKELDEKYKHEKKEKEYWYYFNVDDLC